MAKDQHLNIAETFLLIMDRKWTIGLTVTLVLLVALWYNTQMPSIYRATATLIIDKETTKSPITGQENNFETYLSESLTFNTHFELITSRQVLEQTARSLKLDQEPTIPGSRGPDGVHPIRRLLNRYRDNLATLFRRGPSQPAASNPGTPADPVQTLKGMLEIENVEDTRLLKIHASDPDPVLAMRVANGLAKAYIDFNIDNRMKSSQDTLNWLTNHLYEMKKNLEDAEGEFLAFKQEAKVISVEGRQQLIAQKITDFNDAYLQARNRRLELDSKLEQLKKIADTGGVVPLLRSLIANDLINDLNSQLVQSEMNLSRLSKVYKSKHPKIVQVQTDIDQTRLKLREEIRKELESLKAERAVLMDKEQVLQQTIADFEKEGMEINESELEHAILSRNVQSNQGIYDALLARLKEADITGNLYVSNIRIVEKAVQPTEPVGPNKRRNLLLAALLGLVLGLGLSFVQEFLDRTLHSEEDVKKYLNLPVLAVIPKADGDQTGPYGTRSRAAGKTVAKGDN